MAKTNFRQDKRQRELARKARQTERLSRRGEKVTEDPRGAPLVATTPPKPDAT